MCKFSSKSGGVPFQISFFWGDLTRNDPPDSPVYSLQMIDYIQFTIAPHNESPESSFAYIFKPLAEALDTAAFNIDPENSTSLKHCQANIQQLIFLMHLTLQVLGVFDD